MTGIVIEKFVDKSTKVWRERYQIFWPDGGFSDITVGKECVVRWSNGNMIKAGSGHKKDCMEVINEWKTRN